MFSGFVRGSALMQDLLKTKSEGYSPGTKWILLRTRWGSSDQDHKLNNGFTASSTIWGGQFAVQLPTRWLTLVASAYRGGDLRFFFGGQVNSYATDTSGLTNIQGPFQTLDGGCLVAAGCAVLGTNAAGNVVVAPQKPIHAFGGFVNLGLPLSRWFNADPKGHNAGWQLCTWARTRS